MMRALLFILIICFSAIAAAAQIEVTLIPDKVTLRGTPSEIGKVVCEVRRGAKIDVVKQSGVWFLVQTPEFVGWLHGDTLKIADSLDSALGIPTKTTDRPFYAVPTVTPNRSSTTPTQAPLNAASQPTVQPTASKPAATRSGYIRGPRGGCYYLSSSGKKVYVDRGLCS